MSPLVVTEPPNPILGCGYLGRRVAARWLALGKRVVALTRRNAAPLHAIGIETLTGDVLDPHSLKQLPRAASVLYAVGLDRASGKSMREVYVSGLANVLEALPPCHRFIYISSTSVYGQTDGGSVSELAATDPVDESGQILRTAEGLLLEKQSNACILRFAGIYGPDRLLRKQPLLKGEPLAGDADKWLNLIHVADGASAVLAAETDALPGGIYNIADGTPVTRRDFYTFLANLLHAPPARFNHEPEPGSANRRIDAARARTELNWVPSFTNYRDGLTAAVLESTI